MNIVIRLTTSSLSFLLKIQTIILSAVISLSALSGCADKPATSQSSLEKLPDDAPRGYVKFFRTGLLDFAQNFQIYKVNFGKEVFLGEVTGNDIPVCVAVRPGINMFKIKAPMDKKDLETLMVEEDKIIRVNIEVAWSHGHRFDYNIPYRWDVTHPVEAEPLEVGECADQIGSSPPQLVEPEEPEESAESTESTKPSPSS